MLVDGEIQVLSLEVKDDIQYDLSSSLFITCLGDTCSTSFETVLIKGTIFLKTVRSKKKGMKVTGTHFNRDDAAGFVVVGFAGVILVQ